MMQNNHEIRESVWLYDRIDIMESWTEELEDKLIPRLHDEASSTSWLDKRFTMKPASSMLHDCFMKLAREASFK